MASKCSAKIPRSNRNACKMEKEVEESGSNDKDPNPPVELSYDVLTILFKNLNAKDLRNAAMVCRCWSELADKEKRLRVSKPWTCLEKIDESWNGTWAGKPLIDHIQTPPILSMMFMNPPPTRLRKLMERNSLLCPCKVLPTGCTNISVISDRIIKDSKDYHQRSHTALMLLFKAEGITVQMEYDAWPKPEAVVSQRDGNEKTDPKCTIVLRSSAGIKYESIETLFGMHKTFSRQSDGPLAGCDPTSGLSVCTRQICSKPVSQVWLTISGPSLRCWTAVAQKEHTEEQQVEDILVELKGKVEPRKHTIAFMFASTVRGKDLYGESDVESTIFKKIFPEIPLIGCFGNGVFEKSLVAVLTGFSHRSSTTFMILTYGT